MYDAHAAQLVEWAKAAFPKPICDVAGRPTVPVELLVLGSLRIAGTVGTGGRSRISLRRARAGRGALFDDISEITGIGVTTMQRWHHKFTAKFVAEHRVNWLRPPNREELAKIMEVYAAKGMTGACGSIDCTHIVLDKAPSGHRNLNVGRCGKPTLSFEAIVGPDRFIHSFTDGAHGAQNDKTVAVTDAYLLSIRDQSFFPDVTYTLRKADGSEVPHRGARTALRTALHQKMSAPHRVVAAQ